MAQESDQSINDQYQRGEQRMPSNGPSQAERGFIKQQEVYGVTLTYDQAGQIVERSAGVQRNGAFAELWIRWNKVGEVEKQVEGVSGHNEKVEIDVTGNKKYKVTLATGNFQRTGGGGQPESGHISELHIRADNESEKTVFDVFPACDEDGNVIFIVTRDNPTCRYRLNQATGQWERVCT